MCSLTSSNNNKSHFLARKPINHSRLALARLLLLFLSAYLYAEWANITCVWRFSLRLTAVSFTILVWIYSFARFACLLVVQKNSMIHIDSFVFVVLPSTPSVKSNGTVPGTLSSISVTYGLTHLLLLGSHTHKLLSAARHYTSRLGRRARYTSPRLS